MKKTLSLLFMLMLLNSKAQIDTFFENNLVWLDLTLTLQDTLRTNQKYIVAIQNKSTPETIAIKTDSKPNFGLKYNSVYDLIFTCDKCNAKIIEINTNAPLDKWILKADVKLQYHDNTVSKAGKIFYSEKDKDFKSEKY